MKKGIYKIIFKLTNLCNKSFYSMSKNNKELKKENQELKKENQELKKEIESPTCEQDINRIKKKLGIYKE